MHPMTRPVAVSALAAFAALFATGIADPADARSRGEANRDNFALSARSAGAPLMAVISLNDQRVTIYDAGGKILRAPVSTGRTGYETPAGIYSIIEKNREHYSNLYDDASMPFMQRITWSGIALHAGVLPGQPASHGCIRLPHRFAEQIFDMTKLGMRVVVVRDDMSPIEIAHPALFKPGPVRSEVALASTSGRSDTVDGRSMRLGVPPADAGTPARAQTWRQIATAKAAQAEAAARTAEETRRLAVKVRADAAWHMKDLRRAEGAKSRAETLLKEAERILEAASSPEATQKAEEIKAKAAARLAEAQVSLDAVKTEAQPKIDAAEEARATANAAEAARVAAQAEAKLAEAKMAPVSVFISRQTQRLYVRQAFQPIFDTEVTIRDPDTPIGTTIYTALSYANDGADVRWSALAMYAKGASPGAPASGSRRVGGDHRKAEGASTDAGTAKAALERISIPQEAIERINEVVSPGSSLIVSDEPMSAKETGKGTDFIVLMSGEPQGGIKTRRRPNSDGYGGYGYERRYRRPYGGGGSFWW
jgi:hypothetical protein